MIISAKKKDFFHLRIRKMHLARRLKCKWYWSGTGAKFPPNRCFCCGRASRLNHGSLKHSEPTSQLMCSTLLERETKSFSEYLNWSHSKNMRIWNEKSSIDGFQPCLSKLLYIKGIKNSQFSIPKSPFLPLSFSWHYIHLANLLLSCTNISNHYFPSSLIQWIKTIFSVTDNPLYWDSYQDFTLFHPLLLLLLLPNPLLFLRLLFVPSSIQTCRNPRNGSLFCFIFSFITKYKYLWQMKVGAHQLEFCISLQIFLTENQHFDYSSAHWWTFVSPCPGMYSIWPTKFSLTDILFRFLIIPVTELELL